MDCFSEMAEQYAALLTSRMNIRTSREMDRTLCNEVFALRFLQQHGAVAVGAAHQLDQLVGPLQGAGGGPG